MAGPLQGYRIVDLTAMISGPLVTMTLADQGADAIKITSPKSGDYTCQVSSRRAGMAASFLNNNRNQIAIVITARKLQPPPVQTSGSEQ